MLMLFTLWAVPGWALEAPETLVVTLRETGQMWFDAVEQAHPAPPDLHAFAQLLLEREDIADATVDDGSIMVTSSGGVLVCYDVEEPGVLGSPTSEAASEVNDRYALLSTSLLPGRAVPGQPRTYGDLVPGGTALILRSLMPGYKELTRDMSQILTEAGFLVDYRRADLHHFLRIPQASVVIINTHASLRKAGEFKRFSLTANRFETTDAGHLSLLNWLRQGEHMIWLHEHDIALGIYIEKDSQTHIPTRLVTGILLFEAWFEKNIEQMVDNSFVILLTCSGADTPQPWEIFRDRGASAFLGFTGRAGNEWASEFAVMMLERLYGQSMDRPTHGAPLRRAQCFEDAFDTIAAKPEYQPHADTMPVLRGAWEGPLSFSASPYIEYAWVYRFPGSANYTLWMGGAFGASGDYTLTIDGQPLHLQWASPGPVRCHAVLPAGVYGDLVVTDRWGRQSNAVTISRFNARVIVDYEDPFMAGTIEVDYTEPVSGARLYRGLSDELVFAGSRAANYEREQQWVGERDASLAPFGSYVDLSPGWPLVWGTGDVRVSWDFDSVKTVDQKTYVTSDHGTRSYRASDITAYMGPYAKLQAFMPVATAPDVTTCDTLVSLALGLDLHNVTINGEPAEGPWRMSLDVSEGETTYDWRRGVLNGIQVQGEKATWRIETVELLPRPYDRNDRAALPSATPPGLP